MSNSFKGTTTKKSSNHTLLYITLIILATFIGVTLAFFFTSDFASSWLGISGKVNITAVGSGEAYKSIEDKNGMCNMIITLQDGYTHLIPNMEISAIANVKVHKSTTKPLLRANVNVVMCDLDGNEYNGDTENVSADLTDQLNDQIASSNGWYKYTDNYYYYIGDNEIQASSSETLLSEVDATSKDTIVHFINTPIRFPSYVTSDYSGFVIKITVTFQAIQNFIPDEDGNQIANSIENSIRLFSSITSN